MSNEINTTEKQYKSGKGYGKKTGAKFTKTQREEVKVRVAMLDRRGCNITQISVLLKDEFDISVGPAMVAIYLRQIREAYLASIESERSILVQEKLAQYREIRYEAWMAYERSKLDTKKTVSEFIPVRPKPVDPKAKQSTKPTTLVPSRSPEDAMMLLKAVVTQEGRLPANDYLRTIMTTLENERELLGIDAPKEISHSGSMQIINWNAVLFQKEMPTADDIGYVHDPVLNRILQVENLPEKVGDRDTEESESVLEEQEH